MNDRIHNRSPESEAQVIEANIEYHTALAANYDLSQPHFRPENVARVDQILSEMAARTGGGSLLDLGCGTGFLLNIAKRHFRRVVGVDLTPAMLQRVDRSGGVEVFEANTASLPFADGEFDVCTAYSYLHHLHQLQPTFHEAARCLRPGGEFFADQDPNKGFWSLAYELRNAVDLPQGLQREVRSVVQADTDIATEFGLTPEVVARAEYQKVRHGGIDPEITIQLLREAGFRTAAYRYEWYLGQGKLLHEESEARAAQIEMYLRDYLPATSILFKYVSFYSVK